MTAHPPTGTLSAASGVAGSSRATAATVGLSCGGMFWRRNQTVYTRLYPPSATSGPGGSSVSRPSHLAVASLLTLVAALSAVQPAAADPNSHTWTGAINDVAPANTATHSHVPVALVFNCPTNAAHALELTLRPKTVPNGATFALDQVRLTVTMSASGRVVHDDSASGPAKVALLDAEVCKEGFYVITLTGLDIADPAGDSYLLVLKLIAYVS